MDRVYESNAAAGPPSPPATPSTGYPTAGDPVAGIPATRPGDYWYHMVTEEILAAISSAGLTPDHTNLAQLRDAIIALSSQNSAPVGSVIAWTSTTPPDNYLECNGAAISRTAYSDLFAVIGTIFGAGDGSTTFNLPDLRGEFIRGYDNGRGADVGRALGSAQSWAIENIVGET
ncbi:MAG: tail fiber protein, partial [Gammaproteobacteria bacterium]